MTRFIRPVCMSDSYVNHKLTLKTSSPPRTSISAPNSVTHPQPLPSPPQSLSQSIFYKIAAANVALSCILGFPHSYRELKETIKQLKILYLPITFGVSEKRLRG
ncbi:hypothetical protein T07_7404 [Trichinella nelsoni]|uniref:Uncharacterized protein n=1 Tax=Trichinella nelsoni TaxID=6336 RepID=A0A0V0RCH3_9BILA|nr:hypothetical protein T07_7404 [Trichinella nelsoni]